MQRKTEGLSTRGPHRRCVNVGGVVGVAGWTISPPHCIELHLIAPPLRFECFGRENLEQQSRRQDFFFLQLHRNSGGLGGDFYRERRGLGRGASEKNHPPVHS